MLVVTITMALAVVAVLGAIVVVAVGGGGQLSTEHPDHPPLALPGGRTAGGTDAALLRLPLGLWGYHKQITDEALQRFAHELTERDTRIAVLEQELAEARHGRDGDVRDRRPALPPARNDMPVMGEGPTADSTVTRTDVRPSLASGRQEPAAAERKDDLGADEAGYAAPRTDPWQTILDRPAGTAEHGPSDDVEDRPAERSAEEPARWWTEPAERKDDGE